MTTSFRICTVLIALAGTAAALAGPVTPPAGPITSTYKTLAEIEPRIAINAANTPGDATNLFVINQPGSYYLTGNINGVAGKSGIAIRADNVTIDLGGFSLIGVAGSEYGVVCFEVRPNIEIRAGAVRGWGNTGVSLDHIQGGRLRDLRLSENYFGAAIGSSFVVSDCTAVDNTHLGFVDAYNSVFTRCVVDGGGNTQGFSTQRGCSFVDCTASKCTIGIYAGSASIIARCTLIDNAVGVQSYSDNQITGCLFTAFAPGSIGIKMTAGIHHCVVQDNTFMVSGAGSTALTIDGTGHVMVQNRFSGCTAIYTGGFPADGIRGPTLAPANMSGSTATTPLNPWANLVN